MPRPKTVIDMERSGWRVPEGTTSLVAAIKTAAPPQGAGEWTEGRVVAWAVLALAEQMGNDERRSPAERALIRERAAVLRATLGREANAKEQK